MYKELILCSYIRIKTIAGTCPDACKNGEILMINNIGRSRKPICGMGCTYLIVSGWDTKEIVLSKDIPIHINVHLLINYNSQLHALHMNIFSIRKVNPIQKLNSLCRFV